MAQRKLSESTGGSGGQDSSTAVSPFPGTQRYTPIGVLKEGNYGKIELIVDKRTGVRYALKQVKKDSIKFKEFNRETTLSCELSVHAAIVATLPDTFESTDAYMMLQEYAPYGDLLEAIPPQKGLDEIRAKSCLAQVAAALSFLHSKRLVHGDVKPENVLLFDKDLTVAKLSDFGRTRRRGSLVRKNARSIPYSPPEVCQALENESFAVEPSQDSWHFGVMLFCVLTGMFPWEQADQTRSSCFEEFVRWQKRKITIAPPAWRNFTPKLLKLCRKLLEPKAERRGSVSQIHKYVADPWLKRPTDSSPPSRAGTGAAAAKRSSLGQNQDSNLKEQAGENGSNDSNNNRTCMDELRDKLEAHGVVTRTDKDQRKQRTADWVRDACVNHTEKQS
ncbi:serine/threonine-protein kinase SBK1-like [Diadema antillarum]|uniref:serine/threonine-protein kinase SBK1-like n=1 Tax=Diadema antillarum TaxID=105358 RepID=UPI003A848322